MYGQQGEELSHDLVLSITRILDLKASPETDPLDTVGDGFDVIDVVNEYFPDGAFALVEATTKLSTLFVPYPEQSLGKLGAIQAQLAQDDQDLWDEIVRLQEELRGQQESGKVQLIQEMISVCI
jgi:vacuolar protein sorting-associated protein 53